MPVGSAASLSWDSASPLSDWAPSSGEEATGVRAVRILGRLELGFISRGSQYIQAEHSYEASNVSIARNQVCSLFVHFLVGNHGFRRVHDCIAPMICEPFAVPRSKISAHRELLCAVYRDL